MSAPFLDQLARRLGVSPDEAERALVEVGRLIRARLDASEEVHIEGLGSFRQDDGTLSFEPAATLDRMVNVRYAGLPVVQLPAVTGRRAATPADLGEIEDPFARVETETPRGSEVPATDPLRDITSEELQDEFGAEPELSLEAEAEPAIDNEVEPSPEPEPEDAAPRELTRELEPDTPERPTEDAFEDAELAEAEETSDEEDIEAMLAGVWTPRMGPEARDHPLGPVPAELLEEADFQVMPSARPPPDRSQEGPGDRRDRPPPRAQRQGLAFDFEEPPPRDRRVWPIVVAAVIVLAAVAGAFYFTQISERAPGVDRDVVATQPEPPPAADEPGAAEPDPAGPPPVEAPPPELEAPEVSALRAPDGVEPARGGFTWVISKPTAAEARQRAERYREQGYRVSVLPATIRGVTYHRVAIGQFATRAEAEQHRDQLPRDVPPDIWILEL